MRLTAKGRFLHFIWTALVASSLALAYGGCWKTRDSSLFLAASEGDVKTVRSLIDTGENVNARDTEGETPLMYAAVRGQTQVVLLLLSKGAQIDVVSVNGETALDRAASAGFTAAVRVLIEKGANKEIGVPLIEALSKGHLDIVGLLVAKGANVNAEDTAGDAALSYASKQGAPVEIIKEMIAAGSDVKHRNKQGKTAEDLAAENGHKEIAELLKKAAGTP